MENKNNDDKLLKQITCPICKARVLLEYEKRVNRNMVSYNIKITKGCKHFCEGELINEQYSRLLKSLVENKQETYNNLVQSRARRKLSEMGLNREDIQGLF